MNITEISLLADKAWVKGMVKGVVSQTKEIKPGMQVGKLSGDGGTIDLTAFNLNLAQFEGKAVVFSGMGMQKDSYNGSPKMTVRDKTKVSVDTSAQALAGLNQKAVAYEKAVQSAQQHPSAENTEEWIGDKGALLEMCIKEGEAIRVNLAEVLEMTVEDAVKCGMSLFIEYNRRH
jgi:hypothetical protein